MSRLRGFRWARRLPMPHTPPRSMVSVVNNLRARVLTVVGAVASKRFVLRRD